MKLHKFSVYFIGRGEEVVFAGSQSDAVILACANRINKGLHRMGYHVQNHDTGEMWGLTGVNTLKVTFVK